jgi:hypothetical protein
MNPLQSPETLRTMSKLIFAMNQSLGFYVDHDAMAPSPAVFRHCVFPGRTR